MAYSNKEQVPFEETVKEMQKSGDLYIEFAKSEIAEQISKTMRQAGINKAELARRLGKTRAFVTMVLQGNTNFTIESLVKIADSLGCKLEIKLSQKVSVTELSSENTHIWDDLSLAA